MDTFTQNLSAVLRYTLADAGDFHRMLEQEPDERMHSLAYADWLQEQGHAPLYTLKDHIYARVLRSESTVCSARRRQRPGPSATAGQPAGCSSSAASRTGPAAGRSGRIGGGAETPAVTGTPIVCVALSGLLTPPPSHSPCPPTPRGLLVCRYACPSCS